ncbi:hypothetical protein PVK06_035758 [Gossypium arboreum]|uniref:Uncharacterized protein n=1 Tax=Gossypium arboreum TaxID=29729 RepID=A0ABR0NHM7_GOSAR|nr:hypothetical protein PVK06_035758 [Gossypium arboreum]
MEAMVQTHIASGSPILELYANFASTDKGEGIESDNDPIRESKLDGLEIALFFKLESIPTKPEDRGSDGEVLEEDVEEDP